MDILKGNKISKYAIFIQPLKIVRLIGSPKLDGVTKNRL